jgi:hypothetical protein
MRLLLFIAYLLISLVVLGLGVWTVFYANPGFGLLLAALGILGAQAAKSMLR